MSETCHQLLVKVLLRHGISVYIKIAFYNRPDIVIKDFKEHESFAMATIIVFVKNISVKEFNNNSTYNDLEREITRMLPFSIKHFSCRRRNAKNCEIEYCNKISQNSRKSIVLENIKDCFRLNSWDEELPLLTFRPTRLFLLLLSERLIYTIKYLYLDKIVVK